MGPRDVGKSARGRHDQRTGGGHVRMTLDQRSNPGCAEIEAVLLRWLIVELERPTWDQFGVGVRAAHIDDGEANPCVTAGGKVFGAASSQPFSARQNFTTPRWRLALTRRVWSLVCPRGHLVSDIRQMQALVTPRHDRLVSPAALDFRDQCAQVGS